MSVAALILCAFAVWALFRFADGLADVARGLQALARAVGDE